MKKRIQKSQYGTNKVKNFFTYITDHLYKFILLLIVLTGLITWIVIILTSENIKLDKDGFEVKKKSVNIEKHIFQRKK